jgi:hypothetical protein
MRGLILHRFLLRAALAASAIFAWIFVFQYFYFISPDAGHALARVALLYALCQTITCLTTPYAASALRNGIKRELIFATLAASCAIAILALALKDFFGTSLVGASIATFAIFLGLYRGLYFVPYATEAAEQTQKRNLGVELLVALLPAIAGLAIATSAQAPTWLLFGGAFLIVLSVAPLSFLPETFEEFAWGYRDTFVKLFELENGCLVITGFFEGVSAAALLFFWPIAVFLILGFSYGLLGIILSLTYIMTLLLRKLVRRLIRSTSLRNSLAFNATVAISPWILRLLVATPLGIISTDSFFYSTTARQSGMDPLVYEQAADGNSYIDEYTALKEISLSFGRIAAALFVATIAITVSLPAAFVGMFVAAAFSSFFGVLLSR